MIRLLSLNLQYGKPGAGASQDPATASLAGRDVRDPGAAREVLAALAQQLRDLAPDVVALQEVDMRQRRSGGLDQAAELARLLGWDSHRFAATYAGPVAGLRRRPLRSPLARATDDVLGPARAVLGKGPAGFGNALLTRFPVSAWRVQRLGRGPAQVTRRPGHPLNPRSYRLSTSTMRNMISARIELPSGPAPQDPRTREPGGRMGPGGSGAAERGLLGGAAGLTVASTHLATRSDVAASQLAAAWAALASLPGPHVLAGDLNLRPDGLEPLGIARPLGEGATYPAGSPKHRIDHILADPWPVDAAGRPLPATGPDAQEPRAEAGTAVGPASGTATDSVSGSVASAPLLQAVDCGVRSLVVSDHAATWVDLAPVG